MSSYLSWQATINTTTVLHDTEMSGTMTTTATPGTGTGRERGTTRRTGTVRRGTETRGIGRNGMSDLLETTTRKIDMRGEII